MDYGSYKYTNSEQEKINIDEKHQEHTILNQRTQDLLIKGIFLMFLSVIGNFLDTMLPCQTRKIIKQQSLLRHVLAFITIYFVIDYTSTKIVNPLNHFKNSIFIYILFILFTKSVLFFSIISIVLLSINYVIGNYIEYNNYKHEPVEHLVKTENVINIVIILNIVIGVVHYIYKQLKEQKEFNSYKFIIGNVDCN